MKGTSILVVFETTPIDCGKRVVIVANVASIIVGVVVGIYVALGEIST